MNPKLAELLAGSKNAAVKSWRTTLCGALAAAGIYITENDPSLAMLGQILTVGGVFLMGLFSRDNSVPSEKANPPKV